MSDTGPAGTTASSHEAVTRVEHAEQDPHASRQTVDQLRQELGARNWPESARTSPAITALGERLPEQQTTAATEWADGLQRDLDQTRAVVYSGDGGMGMGRYGGQDRSTAGLVAGRWWGRAGGGGVGGCRDGDRVGGEEGAAGCGSGG
ncbi:hypothetical protein [Actinoplanes sp. NPDC020271]|uniref:hypothetical protein n=1 Tax=Actinoplanes sp. NPDC020271 TaxID=3363896 RepID=UPI0037952412